MQDHLVVANVAENRHGASTLEAGAGEVEAVVAFVHKSVDRPRLGQSRGGGQTIRRIDRHELLAARGDDDVALGVRGQTKGIGLARAVNEQLSSSDLVKGFWPVRGPDSVAEDLELVLRPRRGVRVARPDGQKLGA